MVRIPPAIRTFAKSHTLAYHYLNPRSMAPIGSIATTTAGPLLAPSITGRAVSDLVHIRFPVARDLSFIAMTLTIR